MRSHSPWIHVLLGVVLIVVLVVLLKTAWVCDDAYISFRTVDNAVHGHGLRWNADERVQAYTHPLWVLLLVPVYAVTREIYLTSLLVSMALSLGVFLALWRAGRGHPGGVLLAAALLLSSNAFMDYSTSGLENPLSHLLLIGFFLHYFRSADDRKSMALSAFLAALLALNRLDLGLICVFPLLHRLRRVGPPGVPALVLGLSPLLVWEAFSLVYYGFPFPNTAYAKLNTGIDRWALVRQGLVYFRDSWKMDFTTLPAVILAVAAGLPAAEPRLRMAAISIVLYLAYVVSIGGDFMAGRFLAAPLLVGVLIVIHRFPRVRLRGGALAAAAVVAVSLISPHSSLRAGRDYGTDFYEKPGKYRNDTTHIADERGFYYPSAGLLRRGHRETQPGHPYVGEGLDARRRGVRVQVWESTGFRGYFAGPGVFIIDPLALSDPLLSRLPAFHRRDFYIGHFRRSLPPGYEISVRGENRVQDPGVRRYYDDIRLITRGPLFDPARWSAIRRTNLGTNRAWLEPYVNGGHAVQSAP